MAYLIDVRAQLSECQKVHSSSQNRPCDFDLRKREGENREASFFPHNTTTMLKPRLRIPRSGGLLRPTSTSSSSSYSPFARATAAAAATPKLQQQQRSFQTHRVPALPYADKFLSEGVPNLYSKEGFAAAWNIYMEWCLGKLNERIAGTFGSIQRARSRTKTNRNS